MADLEELQELLERERQSRLLLQAVHLQTLTLLLKTYGVLEAAAKGEEPDHPAFPAEDVLRELVDMLNVTSAAEARRRVELLETTELWQPPARETGQGTPDGLTESKA